MADPTEDELAEEFAGEEDLAAEFAAEAKPQIRTINNSANRPLTQVPEFHDYTKATDASAFLAGAKPESLDYIGPALGELVRMHQSGYPGQKLTPDQWKALGPVLDQLPKEQSDALVRSLLKPQMAADIEQNIGERKEAYASDPGSYALGKVGAGVLGGIALGGAAGPGVAEQGLAGMAQGFIQDADPKSALAGGALGAGIPAMVGTLGKNFAGMSRRALGAGAAPGAGDEMIAKGMGYDSPEITAMKANDQYFNRVKQVAQSLGVDDYEAAEFMKALGHDVPFGGQPSMSDMASVVRANARSPYGAQTIRDNIQLPAIARGAGGTDANPEIVSDMVSGHMPATMQPAPTLMSSPAAIKRTPMQGPGMPQRIDLDQGMPDDMNTLLNDVNGGGQSRPGLDLYKRASSADLENIAPASKFSRGAQRLENPRYLNYGEPEQVNLDIVEQTSVPPLSPAERSVSAKATEMANKSGGLAHVAGQSTPQGVIRGAAMARGELALGIAGPAKARKMLELMNSGRLQKAAGQMSAVTSRMANLIQNVEESDDPVVIDYMYQEMYPEYRQLSLEAENALAKEDKSSGGMWHEKL